MGLYDDDNNAITAGDVLDVIYWQTKFAHLKLEAALQSRQPEHAVGSLLPDVINGATDVLQTYPNHAEVQGWKARAEQIRTKINPNAAPAAFRGDFDHWKDYSYEAGWRSYHVARMAAEAQDWNVALQHAREVLTQFGRSLDRMAHWPAPVQEFIRTAREEADAIRQQAEGRR